MLHLRPADPPARIEPIPRPSDFRGNPLPVGHAISEKIELRRARLREVGAEILARDGIDSAGMVHIARAAGIHPSTAMHAYPRRRDLLHDILHTHIDTLHEILGGTDDALEDHTPEVRLEAAIAALLDGIKKHNSAHKLAHAALSSLPPEVRDNQRHRYRLLVFRLGLIIERALPGLETQRALVSPLARGLLATIAEAAFWFRDDGAFSRADFARLLTRQTLAGGAAAIAACEGAPASHADRQEV